MQSTGLATIDEPFVFTVTEHTIATTSAEYMTLRVRGTEDKEGMLAVQKAKRQCVTARTTIEAERKAAKEPYLEAGKQIDAVAKRLTELLAPVEKHLTAEIIKAEAEAARAEAARLDKRQFERAERLTAVGGNPGAVSIRLMTDNEFDLLLQGTIERVREEKERAAERAQLVEERRKLDAERAKHQRTVDAQRREQAERDRQAILKQEQDAESVRIEREAFNSMQAKLRREDLAPDIEKVAYFAARMRLIEVPQLSQDAAFMTSRLITLVGQFADAILKISERV